jgi:hypothetical protein
MTRDQEFQVIAGSAGFLLPALLMGKTDDFPPLCTFELWLSSLEFAYSFYLRTTLTCVGLEGGGLSQFTAPAGSRGLSR